MTAARVLEAHASLVSAGVGLEACRDILMVLSAIARRENEAQHTTKDQEDRWRRIAAELADGYKAVRTAWDLVDEAREALDGAALVMRI